MGVSLCSGVLFSLSICECAFTYMTVLNIIGGDNLRKLAEFCVSVSREGERKRVVGFVLHLKTEIF